MRLIGIALLPCLAACGVDSEDFEQKFARVSCDQGIQCDEPGFEVYAEASECLPGAVADWRAVVDRGDELGCPLDYAYAADCLKIFRRADCAAIDDRSWESEGACAELFACP